MPLAGLADPIDPWQRIQVKEEVEVSFDVIFVWPCSGLVLMLYKIVV